MVTDYKAMPKFVDMTEGDLEGHPRMTASIGAMLKSLVDYAHEQGYEIDYKAITVRRLGPWPYPQVVVEWVHPDTEIPYGYEADATLWTKAVT